MNTPPPPPTGRRRITDRQLYIQSKLTGRLDAVPLWRARAAAIAVAPALGIGRGAVDLLSTLFGYSRPCDWEAGRLRIVYPSNDELSWKTDLGVRTIQRLLRELLDVGLVRAIDGGTGARRGVRDADGYIRAVSSGLDLSPISDRIGELEQAIADYRAAQAEVKHLGGQIAQERNRTLALMDRGLADHPGDEDWLQIGIEARELASSRKGVREPSALVGILGRLRALRQVAEDRLMSSASVEKTPQDAKTDTPLTTTNKPFIASAIAPGGIRHAHSSISGSSAIRPTKGTGAETVTTASALRGFPATPQLMLKIAPEFRDLVTSPSPSWIELTNAADVVRSHLGISQHAWGQACIVLGRMEATSAIAAISAKNRAGLVRSPGGLLRHMVNAHLKGELRLDRTLFGLADLTESFRGRQREAAKPDRVQIR